jgi:ABC-2 type transport system permease protein
MKKGTYYLEFKLFFRSTAAWVGLFVLLLTGAAGLYFGKALIANQNAVIAKAAEIQKKNTLENIEHFGKDIGLVFFHNKFSIANTPDAWAAFANGQRDVNPYLISVTMLALEGQIYDTDISNPVSMLLGNMDLSFVFIFLFPLVIIAFSYNLIAELREGGVWSILKSQTNELSNVIWKKFVLRIAAVFTVAVVLLLAAIVYLSLPIDLTLFAVSAFLFFYLSFWFAICILFVLLGKSSSFTASSLVAFWVVICIVIPASLNLYLTQRYPVPEALQNVINQREGYHEKWDLAKDVTMKPFFEHYPQFKKYPFPDSLSFSWYWYFGMQQMGDDQAKSSRKAIQNKLAARQQFTNTMALFFPTIQTQLGINELAGSDLNTHLNFQDKVRKYHEEVRLHFYPAIFQDQSIASTDLQDYGMQTFEDSKIFGWHRLLSVLITIVVLTVLARLNFRKLSILK